tara:strand:- start:142888 stop:143811 length:924 start_codon:yes stop_codon:yes gene_type:complete
MRFYQWIFVVGLLAGVAALFIAFSNEQDEIVSPPGNSSQIEAGKVLPESPPADPGAVGEDMDRPELDIDENAGPVVIVDTFPSDSQPTIQEWRGIEGTAGHFDRLDRLVATGFPESDISPNDILIARGWAGDLGLGLRLNDVVLGRCGRIVARAQVTLARPDVAKAVHPNLLRSGWEAQLFAGDLPSCGDDNLSAWAVIPGSPARLIALVGQHAVNVAGFAVNDVPHVSAQTVIRPDAYPAPPEASFDVLATVANMRSCGSTKCPVVSKVARGTHSGVLLENNGSWSLLAFGERQGWLFNDLYRRAQ